MSGKRILIDRIGDKQMLISRIKKSYREVINQVDNIQPIVELTDIRPAANSNSFSQSEMQARRQRRERRMERSKQHTNVGWTARAW